MKRYQVTRRVEVGDAPRLVRCGSCNAGSPEEAVRTIARATGVDPRLLSAREVQPLKIPGAKP